MPDASTPSANGTEFSVDTCNVRRAGALLEQLPVAGLILTSALIRIGGLITAISAEFRSCVASVACNFWQFQAWEVKRTIQLGTAYCSFSTAL
jgi:hypothetical protein